MDVTTDISNGNEALNWLHTLTCNLNNYRVTEVAITVDGRGNINGDNVIRCMHEIWVPNNVSHTPSCSKISSIVLIHYSTMQSRWPAQMALFCSKSFIVIIAFLTAFCTPWTVVSSLGAADLGT
eukprot:TRINITY_DN10834_c0_g1_i2.p1 TRINITY_DN10834_c0_g1~~TRINITY_DN10834_c0_g1_i2.p1  ORF type:complete len:124 (-),score=1.12 TRINITY_DN10834_c0_g1_i2:424-795(-)